MTWFDSKLYITMNQNSDLLKKYLSEYHLFNLYINDLETLNVTKDNYLKLVELCDFLIIDNVDILIDHIVICFNFDYNVIHNFKEFYKYNSKRLTKHDRKSLEQAIKLHCLDDYKCYKTYGFSAYWDVSNITDMSRLFWGVDRHKFNGDISLWNVSNVRDMWCMFSGSLFNGNIKHWDVSNVTNMQFMFESSVFDGDISIWKVSNVIDMSYMFHNSKFNKPIDKWDVSKVENMGDMFYGSEFNGDINDWNVSNVKNMKHIFDKSVFNKKLKWYKIENKINKI